MRQETATVLAAILLPPFDRMLAESAIDIVERRLFTDLARKQSIRFRPLVALASRLFQLGKGRG